MSTFTVQLAMEKETKGAVRYMEVDENGPVEFAWAKIGTLYVRKTSFPRNTVPQRLTVTVTPEG